jgi:hypothetical protein
MFRANGLHSKRPDGGVMTINPHNVSRYTLAGTSRVPFNAIKATYAEAF